ncbi:hypothetical protein LCGC14_3122020, partial [marine sediment metagenome]
MNSGISSKGGSASGMTARAALVASSQIPTQSGVGICELISGSSSGDCLR